LPETIAGALASPAGSEATAAVAAGSEAEIPSGEVGIAPGAAGADNAALSPIASGGEADGEADDEAT
jgi:hypothetical protein